jgi:hypothetical protein
MPQCDSGDAATRALAMLSDSPLVAETKFTKRKPAMTALNASGVAPVDPSSFTRLGPGGRASVRLSV